MAGRSVMMLFIAQLLMLFCGPISLVDAVPVTLESRATSSYWLANIQRQGTVAFGNANYKIFRNVKDYGAKGDGSADDTDAINKALSDGSRCGEGCDSTTVTPALVYFPPGTYVVSKPIIMYYYTQLVGDAVDLPVIKASASFQGMAVLDADPYNDDGSNWFTNQNNFFRQVRNFVIDLTGLDMGAGAGIHWQVAQATSLQNIRFEMVKGGGEANKQQGIFMDNGSGGFMTDLTFNGGNYGAFFGSQQFTTRNLTFNDCNTAVYMNWNWLWQLKSISVNNCGVGVNMTNGGFNQTVGSVIIQDSTFVNTPKGVVTAFDDSSVPIAGGALVIDNVDFSGSQVAVEGAAGTTILKGGAVVDSWVQGVTYTPSTATKQKRAEAPAPATTVYIEVVHEICPVPGSTPLAGSVFTRTVAAPSTQATGSTQAPAATGVPTEAAGGSQVASGSQTSASTGIPVSIPAGTAGATQPGSASTGAAGSSSGFVSVPSPSPSGVTYSPASPSPSATGTRDVTSLGACASTPVARARVQTAKPAPTKPAELLANGKFFERSKPQYEGVAASSFVSVKSAGAKGDGTTDDTKAIQSVLDSATADQIVYFDHGAYIITDTIKVPKNIKITGEIWPLLMASGTKFSDEKNPIPMLQVGQPGETGNVELSDLILETKGPAPGAIIVEWNVAEQSQGSVGMWDVHIRIGGSAGTELQSDKCAKNPTSTNTPNPECFGAFMMLHITEKASAYIENSWFWVSDHELDLSDHNQIDIFNGRGVLIESTGPVWMYGTASEHHQLYNYQVINAENVYMSVIQTETPYFQSNPDALTPFTPQKAWNDPDFSTCTTASCRKAWGLRVLSSKDIFLYGGGLYSFFENYGQDCLADESCQENIIQLDCSEVHMYGVSTKASTNMITGTDGKGIVPQIDNRSNFCSTLAMFDQNLG